MNVSSAVRSQYHASLKTLLLCIEACPEALWNDAVDGAAPFWRVAYHALFFTHFYLQKDEHSFMPWSRHREEAHFIGNIHWEGARPPKNCEPYSRQDILEYCSFCDAMIDTGVEALDLSAAESGFPWYAMPKLDHQLVNIRHIQHHAAALATRLRRQAGISIPWVGKG